MQGCDGNIVSEIRNGLEIQETGRKVGEVGRDQTLTCVNSRVWILLCGQWGSYEEFYVE